MKYRQAGLNQTASSAESGISSRSGRRIEKQGSTAKKPHHWRATRGPDKPVMFRQSVPPGYQGLSDFTHPSPAKDCVSIMA